MAGAEGKSVLEEQMALFGKFDECPPLPGYSSNVIAMFQESWDNESLEGERQQDNCAEYRNFVREVIHHLCQNQVKSIQIVSNQVGGLEQFKVGFLKSKDNVLAEKISSTLTRARVTKLVEVTIVYLLTCKGRNQHDKLYGLVRGAYKSSSRGVFIFGPKALLETKSETWRAFLDGMRHTDSLLLRCNQHGLQEEIQTSELFQEFSPFGGCGARCAGRKCSHECHFVCHPQDPDHLSGVYICQEQCDLVCPYGHPCQNRCYEDCSLCTFPVIQKANCIHRKSTKPILCHQQKPCEVPVAVSYKCGHFATVPCVRVDSSRCQHEMKREYPCGHHLTYKCSDPRPPRKCAAEVVLPSSCRHATIKAECSKAHETAERLPCLELCEVKLTCGHLCKRKCHVQDDPDHLTNKCEEPCDRICPEDIHPCSIGHPCHENCPPCSQSVPDVWLCGHWYNVPCHLAFTDYKRNKCRRRCLEKFPCGHACPKTCWEPCGTCEVPALRKVAGCPFGHTVQAVCGGPEPTGCKEIVPSLKPADCGHEVLVECSKVYEVTFYELATMCTTKCTTHFDREGECGHQCRGVCNVCFQGRLHKRCQHTCGKVQFCGHICTFPCGTNCPPCPQACPNQCEHWKCGFECGVPCERSCTKPCPYQCEHSACTKSCGEICDKPMCNESCPKELACGHSCMGLCGESCPPLCGTCNPAELLVGDFSGNSQVAPEGRYIHLEACGHCVELDGWELWLNRETEEILPISCPICHTQASWIRRYSAQFHQNFNLVNSVKEKVFGDRAAIEGALAEAHKTIQGFAVEHRGKLLFRKFVTRIYQEMTPRLRKPSKTQLFASVSLTKAQQLNWLASQWRYASEQVLEAEFTLDDANFTELQAYAEEYIIDMLSTRQWPFHRNEVLALKIERMRLEDTVQLFSRITKRGNGERSVPSEVIAERTFLRLLNLIRKEAPYSMELHEQFLEELKIFDESRTTTLAISDVERKQIVLAFGQRSGRWFKCAKGHIYVVTECGGALEVSKCPDCGSTIGGVNHRMEEHNYLATEMDGATDPIYPTVFERET